MLARGKDGANFTHSDENGLSFHLNLWDEKIGKQGLGVFAWLEKWTNLTINKYQCAIPQKIALFFKFNDIIQLWIQQVKLHYINIVPSLSYTWK